MVSVDGYFEGEGHDISWHNANNEEFEDFVHEQNPTIGTILFGRKTYDMMAAFWPTEQGRTADKPTADIMTATPKIVASHTPFKPEWANTTVVSENVMDEVKKLKEESGKDIAILGSNNFCVSLMEEGLVDEFRIMVNPIALGKGSALFTGLSKPTNLTLASTRAFKSGNILNTYHPAGI